jgi:medium-chain acyl-[acyl-carrier-protein] hydrolase
MTQLQTERWLAYVRPNPRATLRLFCFNYAGGAAAFYRDWGEALGERVEVNPVELPGHGTRLGEPPFEQLEPLVDALAAALSPLLPERPFAFFGHSMGALLSFELARSLRRGAEPQPVRLLVSAHRGPQLPDRDEPAYLLDDEELMAKLRSLGGTPAAALDEPELMRLLLPMVRADFRVCDTYVYRPEPPLACPISAFGGLHDPVVNQAELEGWREQTTAAFRLRMLPGGHFYPSERPGHLLALLRGELAQALDRSVQD